MKKIMSMKKTNKILVALMLCASILCSMFVSTVSAAGAIVTTPSGYQNASDVVYVKKSGYIANWGARGEEATFLSTYAVAFYSNDSYDEISQYAGGTTQSNASSSALYRELQSIMKSAHRKQTSYNETKEMYRYTDCLLSNYNSISSFYTGITLTGDWDKGATWNREHTWPNSKGLEGNDENDIMMLRPTSVKENSSRSNTAYGESSSFYDPGVSVRGDCARIVLYVYVRWGNTGKMWGSSGVMENLNVLLKWMEEDPVDTWEMARNDSVQAITGTRNVFVDYPEYAWLLFGRDIPNDMQTPSGEAALADNNSGSSAPGNGTDEGTTPDADNGSSENTNDQQNGSNSNTGVGSGDTTTPDNSQNNNEQDTTGNGTGTTGQDEEKTEESLFALIIRVIRNIIRSWFGLEMIE